MTDNAAKALQVNSLGRRGGGGGGSGDKRDQERLVDEDAMEGVGTETKQNKWLKPSPVYWCLFVVLLGYC